MEDEKKEDKKGYTFMDKRGLDKEDPGTSYGLKDYDVTSQEKDQPKGHIPTIDFTTLIMSFASAALVSMGRVSDPAHGKVQKNFVIAQQNIDIINLLYEKTKGNLTADEGHLMEQILYELRMCYVEAMKEEK